MRVPTLLLPALLLASSPALAKGPPCACDADLAELGRFRDAIARAETPEDARAMALDKTRLGHEAIRRAGRLLPGDPGIADAEAKLTAFEASLVQAESQDEVAARFDELIARAEPVQGRCDYTTTEVVVIIIGFVLGILPGILFLLLFC